MATPKAWLSLAWVLFLLVLGAAPARGESYVGVFVGGAETANEGIPLTLKHQYPDGLSYENVMVPGRVKLCIDRAFVGGLRLGAWFAREGFPGLHYPDWMRYFGCYLDVSFHRLDYRPQPLDTVAVDGAGPVNGSQEIPKQHHTNRFFSQGRVLTVAFLVAARYGFFPSQEVPFGRLQPYIGVGPGLFIMNQAVTIQTKSYSAEQRQFTPYYDLAPEGESSVSLCLVTDAGLRWMINPRLSVEVFFRYKYARPSFTYRYRDPLSHQSASFSMKPTFNIFAIHLGLAYHF